MPSRKDGPRRTSRAQTAPEGKNDATKEQPNGEVDDFALVSHEECIYRAAVIFLEIAVNSPRDLTATLFQDIKLTARQKSYLKSLVRLALQEAPVLSRLAKAALTVARKLEKEHLYRVACVSRTLTREDLAQATLCYPVTRWNIEKYLWRLEYHLGVNAIGELGDVIARLPQEHQWLRQAIARTVIPALLLCSYDRNDAKELALSKLLGQVLPVSEAERRKLVQQYERRRISLSGALAEVHFGRYGQFYGLPRVRVGEIAEELEKAGQEGLLNEVDLYAEQLKDNPLYQIELVADPYFIKDLAEKCRMVLERRPYFDVKPRQTVLENIGFDPYVALIADIIDEAKKSKTTIKEIAGREGIPVKNIYNFQRRRKYRREKEE
ncbi:MAG: hypothetical protein JW967_10285 [Dehalococcoidales bacterium]|nr:hypothetical protein [Dehalococcoidales bacterium]